MSDPKIVASARSHVPSASVQEEPGTPWPVLGWIGLVFLLVGGVDFLLVWVPPQLGVPEWEFGTVTQSFNGLPILVLGIGLVLAAGEAVERRWWTWLALGVGAVLLLWILAATALWAQTVPVALEMAPQEALGTVREAIAKTAVQAAAYGGVLAYLLLRALLSGRGRSEET